MLHRLRRLVVGPTLLLLPVLLAACSFRAAPSQPDASAPAATPQAAMASKPERAGADLAPPGMPWSLSALETAASRPDERKIIRNAALRIAVPELDSAVAKSEAMLAEHGGYIQESKMEHLTQSYRRATLVLRVPAAGYGSLLATLSRLGEVETREERTDDVTEEFIDLEARLEARREHEIRLRELARQSGSLEELIRLENELARVRGEIESLQGRLHFLRNRVDYSTVRLTLVQPPPGELRTEGLGSRVGQAINQTLQDLGDFTADLIVFVAGALPVLSYLAIPALIVFVVVRRLRGRRRGPAPPLGS